MLHNDGDYIIYLIQHQWKGKGDWKVSVENRIEWPSSHDCWQETGIHGTYNLEEAKQAYGRAVAQLDPDRNFRLAKLTISQKIESLS